MAVWLKGIMNFLQDPDGIDDYVETRTLPEGFPLWWGKAYLFSEDAGLDDQRVPC